MSVPSVVAARASDVSVRTTPLTCGRQASVAIKIRIAGPQEWLIRWLIQRRLIPWGRKISHGCIRRVTSSKCCKGFWVTPPSHPQKMHSQRPACGAFRETVMKQFPNATKSFCRDRANVPKPLTVKQCPNEMLNRQSRSDENRGTAMFNLSAFTHHSRRAAAVAIAFGTFAFAGSASAAPQAPLFPFFLLPPPATQVVPPPSVEAAPVPEERSTFELPARLRRQIVSYP